MRHLKSGSKLNRTASHRSAMLANLATSIFKSERVITTTQKAKAVRSLVDRLITYGKKSDIASIRLAARTIHDKDIVKKIFSDIAPSYKDRNGGYTRIIRYKDRKGDNAELAIIELVGRNEDETRKRKKKRKTGITKQKRDGKSIPSTQSETTNSQEDKKADEQGISNDVQNDSEILLSKNTESSDVSTITHENIKEETREIDKESKEQ